MAIEWIIIEYTNKENYKVSTIPKVSTIIKLVITIYYVIDTLAGINKQRPTGNWH